MKIQMWGSSLVMMLLSLATETAAITNPDYVKPGCQEKCGNISVPYPFGIGKESCAMNEYFFLDCISGDGGQPNLLFGNIPVRNISLLEGTFTLSFPIAFGCPYNNISADRRIRLGAGPYVLSDSRNIFTAIGCDIKAAVTNTQRTFGASCLSLCSNEEVKELKKNCPPGSGCCQTSIPKGLKSIRYSVSTKGTGIPDPSLCGYAFLTDKDTLKISDWQLSGKQKGANRSDVMIEWALKNETCQQAKANYTGAYACGTNASCTDTDNPRGYRCSCNAGFEGNPYLEQGCQDIDECKDPERYPCHGSCENTNGDYKCHCPLGRSGNGKTGCRGLGILTIVDPVLISTAVVVLLLLMGTWRLHKLLKKRRSIRLKREVFKRNGGLWLQQHLSSSDQGVIRQTRVFSSMELQIATDSFNVNRILGQGGQGTVYKGMLVDGEIVAVKKSKIVDERNIEGFINEVVILSQINHRNVVRLLGCCLETEVPLLVYEFIPNGTLSQYLHDQNEEFSLSWEMRLKIAIETAGALFYLHSAASIPIYHRDIKSSNILLDAKYRAKIADFGTSRSLSIDQTHLSTNVQGTFGYLDPEYFRSSRFTEKSDVYSFGVILVELLSGKKPIMLDESQENRSLAAVFFHLMEQNRLFDNLDAQVKEQSPEEEAVAMANIAKKCLYLDEKMRPTMKEVTAELECIGLSRKKKNVQQNNAEFESIMSEVTSMWDAASASIACYSVPGSSADKSSDEETLVTYRTW